MTTALPSDTTSGDVTIADFQEKFSTNNAQIDIFDRHRVTFDGKSHQLVQVAAYREGRLNDALGFDISGKLKRRPVKPAIQSRQAAKHSHA